MLISVDFWKSMHVSAMDSLNREGLPKSSSNLSIQSNSREKIDTSQEGHSGKSQCSKVITVSPKILLLLQF